jgi:hypothetical protein
MFIGMIWRPTVGRTKSFDLAREFWSPYGPIRFFDSGHVVFNRAASRNKAVAAAEHAGQTKLVITDADCVPEPDALEAAWAESDDTAVHLPYTTCLTHTADGEPAAELGFTCGGVYVTTVAAWRAVGGQDERFNLWGPEDFAFMLAHRTLLGRDLVKHPGRLLSLGHELDPNRHTDDDSDELVQLYRRYEAADGNKAAMEALCFPWS